MEKKIKKQLGFIIKTFRKFKYNENKINMKIDENPFSKKNFIKGICHLKTYNSVENGTAQNMETYGLLLRKLGMYYNVSMECHIDNMSTIHVMMKEMLKAIEYIDDNASSDIIRKIKSKDFSRDCIAGINLILIENLYNLQFFRVLDDKKAEELAEISELYDGLYLAGAKLCLGIYNLNKFFPETALKYFDDANKLFNADGYDSEGLLDTYYLSFYRIKGMYFDIITTSARIEPYYVSRKNTKRLLHVYSYLSDYYMLVGKYDRALDYHNKSLEIIDNNPNLKRFVFAIKYNWGYACLLYKGFDEAYVSVKESYDECDMEINKPRILSLLLVIMTKMKFSDNEIRKYADEGKKYITDTGDDYSEELLKYFIYKYENPTYYRKYAFDKLIPLLKKDPDAINLLLFVYEDLYEIG